MGFFTRSHRSQSWQGLTAQKVPWLHAHATMPREGMSTECFTARQGATGRAGSARCTRAPPACSSTASCACMQWARDGVDGRAAAAARFACYVRREQTQSMSPLIFAIAFPHSLSYVTSVHVSTRRFNQNPMKKKRSCTHIHHPAPAARTFLASRFCRRDAVGQTGETSRGRRGCW